MRDTIDMACEAGIDAEKDTLCRYEGWLEPLKAFEALVRADEREACAKVCEEQYKYYGHDHVFAAAIRARGNT
jgi:hypothetical protein